MDLKALRYFVSTVETGSISAAAQACFIAQPSISQAIAKLEMQLDCQLLLRQAKGCVPTQEGRKLYNMAKDLLAHAGSVERAFLSGESPLRLTLRIDPNIRVAVLESLSRRLQTAQPRIMLSLVSGQDSRKQSADMHLTARSNVSVSDMFFPLMKERYVLLVPKNHVLAFKTEFTREDLQQQPLITRIHCENKALFEKTCQHYQLEFQEVAEVESEEWAHSLVAAGLGLCFAALPYAFSDERFEIKPLHRLFEQTIPEREIGLAAKRSEMEKIQRLMPDFLTEAGMSEPVFTR
jgi:DNA-binding transcriptional LysR family regulator